MDIITAGTCKIRAAHTPHSECPGTAPEFPGERVIDSHAKCSPKCSAACTWTPGRDTTTTEISTIEQGRNLAISWDSLRDIMRSDVTMWRNIAATFTAEGKPTRVIARCDAQAEHAQRVLEAMDHLEQLANVR